MKKKSFFYSFIAICMLAGCRGTEKKVHRGSPERMTIDCLLKTTPVKDQGRSDLCWVYSMLATIETEQLMRGDSVNLSPDYVGRMLLQDKMVACYLSGGAQAISMRGMTTALPHLIARHGILPFDSYFTSEPTDFGSLSREVRQMARTAPSLERLKARTVRLLDSKVGHLPQKVFMLGAEYTPQEFGRSVCRPDEYVAITSFTHHPFGRKFVLEVPDNEMRDSLLNVPVDEMMRSAVHALLHGHPVCWEGDISEPGFDLSEGMAEVPYPADKVGQKLRQELFEQRKTTDDHAMELCGLAHDKDKNKYFIAKNSYGKNLPNGGFIFLSYDYVKLKTISLVMTRDAWAWRNVPNKAHVVVGK